MSDAPNRFGEVKSTYYEATWSFCFKYGVKVPLERCLVVPRLYNNKIIIKGTHHNSLNCSLR